MKNVKKDENIWLEFHTKNHSFFRLLIINLNFDVLLNFISKHS
mgnify:CR=1 FL=1